jgi:hypothetical protein
MLQPLDLYTLCILKYFVIFCFFASNKHCLLEFVSRFIAITIFFSSFTLLNKKDSCMVSTHPSFNFRDLSFIRGFKWREGHYFLCNPKGEGYHNLDKHFRGRGSHVFVCIYLHSFWKN